MRQRLLHLVNHHSPAEAFCIVLRSPRTYQALGAALIAAAVAAIALAPLPSLDELQSAAALAAQQRAALAPSGAATEVSASSAAASPRPTMPLPDWNGGAQQPREQQPSPAPAGDREPWQIEGGSGSYHGFTDGRILFVGSTLLSALAAAHKRTCVARRA